jgi:hypothetical protein
VIEPAVSCGGVPMKKGGSGLVCDKAEEAKAVTVIYYNHGDLSLLALVSGCSASSVSLSALEIGRDSRTSR